MLAVYDQSLFEAPLTPSTSLPPETLKARIADMVRNYVTERSPELARRIVEHSSELAMHPALRHSPEECTAWCRMNRHWRLLAAQCAASAAN